MNIREYIDKEGPLLFDGATGTLYASQPGCAGRRVEAANLYEAGKISEIHAAYLKSGCRAIKTNTFSLSTDISQGEKEYAFSIIDAACDIAKAAVNEQQAWVFANIGPAHSGTGLSPAENYIAQAERFIANGLDCFLLETLSSDTGVEEFAAWVKERLAESYIIVSYAVGPDGYTREGQTGIELLERSCTYSGVDAVGLNCFMGPHHMLKYISELPELSRPLSVMPNSGYPTVRGNRAIYGGSPEYFADNMHRIISAGASIVGGCCGTTPEHISRLHSALKSVHPEHSAQSKTHGKDVSAPQSSNRLKEKMDRGERIIAVEYDPPVSDNVKAYMDGVRMLHDAGADAITIADSPVGVPRVDSSLMACKIKRELDVCVVPHMACRDRNLNATKALLLGLSSEGIHNVLFITGDPMPSESRDEVKSVFNCNSRKLAKYVGSFDADTLSVPFNMFGALNLNVRNFDIQLSLAQEKEKNGISCFLTQPVLSREAFENLKRARATLKSKILGGIYPVVSYRNAVFMNNEIAGINVCEEICGLYKGLERAEAEKLALSISTRIAKEIEPYTDGVYIMVPFNRTELVSRIIKNIKENGNYS